MYYPIDTELMKNEFTKYLSKNTSLSDEQINAIVESSIIQEFKKGTILLKKGDRANECYLILKGCIRSYVIKDGEEKTIEFFTEEESVVPPNYGKSIPSDLYLECLEDTTIATSTPKLDIEMYRRCPELETACRLITEKELANYQTFFADYKIASIEERYRQLLKNKPDLIQRVPQYLLANYLGIQPESLSRIRKKISKK